MAKRIGLLGGSFDPVHEAHIALALAARQALELDEVQLIPAAMPWQRGDLKAAAKHRLRMLDIVAAKHPGLTVNPIELERGGTTYTVDTLRALPAGPDYIWLLGADQLANFCTWRNWREITERVDLAVAVRPGTPLHAPDELADWLATRQSPLQQLPFQPMDVSASDIRTRLTSGASTAGLLDPDVATYIATHKLYV
ncbi:MAG TPA: nicotinate (nicotinamide) nucleotide adenylyltransferase [Bordetella sp.]